jgi:NAD(P)H-hydrate epimerase
MNEQATQTVRMVQSAPRLPARPEEGHKGLFGRVLIVGGHDEMVGAPVLAGTAALRMGAGLVRIWRMRS